jgi:hypothetical protein
MAPRIPRLLASLLVAGACRSAAPATDPGPAPATVRRSSAAFGADPFAIAAAIDALGERDLWPGFDPRRVPLAIFDGERTLLFGHPSPPESYSPIAGRDRVHARAGRDSAVTANGTAEIGGRATATILLSGPVSVRAGLVGTAAHERFHVFQRARHPGWSANEVELFTYPFGDAAALALRRLETEALRRGLAARDDAVAACWSGLAMAMRRERFASLAPGAVEWERKSELNEGLAEYVERRAMDHAVAGILPADDFPPEELRRRVYRSGAAIAVMLDRLDPRWRETLERRDSTARDATPLDSLLAEAAQRRVVATSSRLPCAFEAETRESAVRTAARDVAALRERLAAERESVLARPGWTIVLVAPGEPLFPRRFDPLNVRVVAPGEVAHARYLELGNRSGTIQVLGAAALTEAAGAHPLFEGVRAVTVTGLGSEPVVTTEGGVLTIRAEGLTADLRGAVVTSREGRSVVLLAP